MASQTKKPLSWSRPLNTSDSLYHDARQFVFEVAPQPFDGIQFWTIGRQKDRHDVRRLAYSFRFVTSAIVEHQNVQGLRKGGGKAIQP
jgi:hypothetical protein